MKENGLNVSLQIAGLGLTLILDLVAGPLAGFWIGSYLVGHFSLPPQARVIAVILGFVASLFNAVLLVKRMYRLSDKKRF